MRPQQIRQGDVQLQPVASLPAGCTEIPNDSGRIVLAYGEVTGHAHAIADHLDLPSSVQGAASDIAEAAIRRAQAKARLFVAPDGDRFLVVEEPVTLRHEEHSPHRLVPGIYLLPRQVEYSPAALMRVQD